MITAHRYFKFSEKIKVIPLIKTLLRSIAQGNDNNEKIGSKTIKNCGLEDTEVYSMALASAMCNAGFESYRSAFLIAPGRPR